MEYIKEQYRKVSIELSKVKNKLRIVEQDEMVKIYLKLLSEQSNLQKQQNDLYSQIRQNDFKTCNHMWITSKIEHDSIEHRTFKSIGCVKCGLNQEVLDKLENLGFDSLTLEERLMYDVFQGSECFRGRHIPVKCDLILARAVYLKIKENHPNIDDETALKYFEIAIDNMMNIPVSEERKNSRAKRLSLGKNFNQWDAKIYR